MTDLEKILPQATLGKTLIIGCGALSHELVGLKKINGWSHIDLQCLDASLHNRPHMIAPMLNDLILKHKANYEKIFIAYADCGSSGEIAKVISDHNLSMLTGAHCYETFIGKEVFEDLMEEELGTFFLTDFLVKHFDRLVYKGLGLDKHKDLRDQIFGHYKRVLYISQTSDSRLVRKAKLAAKKLNLRFDYKNVGLEKLKTQLETQVLQFENESF